ncbi:MAG: DinB family protein [Acidobacteriales bacterium]|nr:DinB family protein [Terriglobales bacterium]
MTMAEMLLAEFEQEARTTRKFLERLPDDKLTWKPHAKSMSAGQLALHIAGTPGQVVLMAKVDEILPPDFSRPNPQPESTGQVLKVLEESIATVKQVLPTLSDERMQAIWRVKREGQELIAIPRAAMLRNILLNHWYHHRGQFGVYLRLLGAKVPSSYGPSGDELPEFMQ